MNLEERYERTRAKIMLYSMFGEEYEKYVKECKAKNEYILPFRTFMNKVKEILY